MTTRGWFARTIGSFGKQKLDRDFDAELASHLEIATDDNVQRGMSREEARRRALLQLGGIEATRESRRDQRGLPLLEQLWHDMRYGVRTLVNNPGFTLVALLALGLGIGANTALFSVVYSVLLRPLPYADPNHLVVLTQKARAANLDNMPFSAVEIDDYRNQTRTMDQVEEYHSMYFVLLGKEPDRVQTGVVSAGFFPMLGVKPLLGRVFQPSDDLMGAPPVLVLSYNYWQRAFGGDRDIIGKTFRMNDKE
ncbi:MAG TPA: ABC transporter permease, partial [Terriglobales bacterium]|nr:ABC transporter permease [Terriglobales bacterium]